MTTTQSDASLSLFVFMKDNVTGKIKRIAVPCDMQIGLLGKPAELQLLGRLSVSTFDYPAVGGSTVNVSGDVTIANIVVTGTNDGNVIVNMPSGAREGQLLVVKDVSGTSLTTPLVVVSAGELIDGLSSCTLSNSYGSIIFARLSGKWAIISASGILHIFAGPGINVTSGSNGQVTVTGTGVGWSPVDYFNTPGFAEASNQLGNFTLGSAFTLRSIATITGVRFYWAGPAVTMKVALYMSSSGDFSQLTSKTDATTVTGPGYYVIPFNSPFTIDATKINRYMTATVYDMGGTNFTVGAETDPSRPVFPFIGGPQISWVSFSKYAGGNTAPIFDAALDFPTNPVEHYLVEPVFA